VDPRKAKLTVFGEQPTCSAMDLSVGNRFAIPAVPHPESTPPHRQSGALCINVNIARGDVRRKSNTGENTENGNM